MIKLTSMMPTKMHLIAKEYAMLVFNVCPKSYKLIPFLNLWLEIRTLSEDDFFKYFKMPINNVSEPEIQKRYQFVNVGANVEH
jgi:hypothetical protein